MMSRWFALKRTSSSNGKSHSKRTIRVCTSLKTLVTLSKPIIQPMSWSSTASRNGWVLRRLSILSTDRMAIFFLSLNASVPITIQWFLNFYIQRLLGQLSESSLSKHLTCVSRTYSQLQPTNLTYFSPLISRQVVGALTCPNTSLVSPGPTPNLILSRYSQCSSPGKLSELSLVQTPHLCLQDSLPTSACRDTHNHFENMSFQAINWQVTFNKWPYSQHATKMKWNKNTSPKSRLLKLFDALDFTSAMYQPSDHFRTLVQAQHRSRENLGAQYKRS